MLSDSFEQLRRDAEGRRVSGEGFALQLGQDRNASAIFGQIEAQAARLVGDDEESIRNQAGELRSAFVDLFQELGDAPRAFELLNTAANLSQNGLGEYQLFLSTLTDSLSEGIIDSNAIERLDDAIPGIANALADLRGQTLQGLFADFENGSENVEGFITEVQNAIQANALLRNAAGNTDGVISVVQSQAIAGNAESRLRAFQQANAGFIEQAATETDNLFDRIGESASALGDAVGTSLSSALFGTESLSERNARIERIRQQGFALAEAARDSFNSVDTDIIPVADPRDLINADRLDTERIRNEERERIQVEKNIEREKNRAFREFTTRQRQEDRLRERVLAVQNQIAAFDSDQTLGTGQRLGFAELQSRAETAVLDAGARQEQRDVRRNELLEKLSAAQDELRVQRNTRPALNLPSGRQGFFIDDLQTPRSLEITEANIETGQV